MGWLVFGILYSGFYFLAGQLLAADERLFAGFRLAALLVPPLAGVVVIVRNRHRWSGCQWLFWATIALGLATAAIGHIGWITDELLLNRHTPWLGWHAVFILFGTGAPLLAIPRSVARWDMAPPCSVMLTHGICSMPNRQREATWSPTGCRTGQVWHGTVARKRRDGSTFPASVAVVPFGDRQGRITHILSVERDVSEEQLLRDQLVHSERLSAVGQLVSGVAHELNNPLQSVIGYTELLLDEENRGARARRTIAR